MTATAFPDAKPFPGEEEQIRAHDPKDNRPPLEERVLMDFEEELRAKGLDARVAELLASAGRVPEIDSEDIAGKVGDLCKQALTAERAVETVRETQNRPILNAQRALKGRADSIIGPLQAKIREVRSRLDKYVADKAEEARQAQRRADEEARRIREAAEAERQRIADEAAAAGRAVTEEELPPVPIIEAAKVEAPVARGDMGARVGARTVWHHEIESVRQLPDRILKNPRVIEALDKVIGAEIRGGAREIKGTRIWSTQEASVR